jgi:H+/Cl- antiporter ClcA
MNRNDLSLIVSIASALVSVLVTVLVAAFGALAGLVIAAYVVGMASGVLVYGFWRRLRAPSGKSHDTPRS